jgi:CHAT domain-containing protein
MHPPNHIKLERPPKSSSNHFGHITLLKGLSLISLSQSRGALHKAAVTSAAATADILYLATHGLSDPDNPLDGGLVMLSSAQLEDGWWTAREIQKSKLRARLTVLSACQTGLGLAHDGGVIGLARAFQLAGVPRVAMSLWNVDDEATRFLMTHFVRLLASKPPAQAMRLAMIEARRRYREPSLWASFAVFSTGR